MGTSSSGRFSEVQTLLCHLYEASRSGCARAEELMALAAVEHFYNRADYATKYHILIELVENNCRVARELLRTVLTESESELLRHEAAFGLGSIADPTDAQLLAHAMLNDTHLMVRHEAAVALAYVGTEATLEALHRVVTTDPEPAVIQSAQYAIEKIKQRLYHNGLDKATKSDV